MKKKKQSRILLESKKTVSLKEMWDISDIEQLKVFFSHYTLDGIASSIAKYTSSRNTPYEGTEDLLEVFTNLFKLLREATEKYISSNTVDNSNLLDLQDVSNTLSITLQVFEVFQKAFSILSPSSVTARHVNHECKTRKSKQNVTFSATPSYDYVRLLNFIRVYWTMVEDSSLRHSCGRLFEFLLETPSLNTSNYGQDYALYLLLKINGGNGEPLTKDLTCLTKLRDILISVDFEHPETHRLRKELVDCCRHTKLFTCDVGQRFLGFTLGSLHPQLTADVLEICRQRIPTFKSSTGVLTSLGNVLQNAWGLSEGAVRLVLETSIEEMVELGVLCEPKIAALFREVLMGFHKKNDAATMDFVCRSFPPILYRYIPVACWKVRFNATALYCVLFPLVDVSLPLAEYQADLERQYLTLMKLMIDCHPEVRRVAVQGVCRVLSTYWEIVPKEKISILLNALLNEAVRDKSSPLVRASVLEGLASVLNNPASHTTLGALFTKLSDFIHDVSSRVRLAMVKLLKRIVKIKDFSDITRVVSLDDLLLRLVKDYILSRIEETSFFFRKGHHHWRFKQSSENIVLMKTVAYGTFNSFLSDCKQTSTFLAELMFPSVFPSGGLPKRVERILHMAEKYPLALLSVVDLASHRLDQIDCAKLGVAIMSVASRKYCDYLKHKKTSDLNEPKTKHDTVTCVLLRTSGRLFSETLQSFDTKTSEESFLPPEGKRHKRWENRTETENTSTGHGSLMFTEQLKKFLSRHLNIGLFSPFLQGSAPVKLEAFQVILLFTEHSVEFCDSKGSRDIIPLASYLSHLEIFFGQNIMECSHSLNQSMDLNEKNLFLPTSVDVLLEILPICKQNKTLFVHLLDVFAFKPLSVLLRYLGDQMENHVSRNPPITSQISMMCLVINKLLCSPWGMVSSTDHHQELFSNSLFIDFIKTWIQFLRLKDAILHDTKNNSDGDAIFIGIPQVFDAVLQFTFHQCLHTESMAPQFDNLLNEIFEILSLRLTQYKGDSRSDITVFHFLICDTIRVSIVPLILWIIFYRCQKQYNKQAYSSPETGTCFHFSYMASFIAGFLQLSRSVSHNDLSLFPGYQKMKYPESCFLIAARAILPVLDRMVTLQPVQAVELLEPLFTELPCESVIDTIWTNFFSTPCIHRLCRLASHSMEVYIGRLQQKVSSDLPSNLNHQNELHQLKEFQRIEAVLLLIKRFETEILDQYTEDSIINCQQDSVVVVLSTDYSSDNDVSTPQVDRIKCQES